MKKEFIFERDGFAGFCLGEPNEDDLQMIMATIIKKQNLDKLKNAKIKTDEEYQKLGERFPEDE